MLDTQIRFKPEVPQLHAIKPLRSSALHMRSADESHSLWLHIHLPQFALDILTCANTGRRACVLAQEQQRGMKIVLANSHAGSLGVRVGMPLAAAEILGELTVLLRDERAEQQALERLCAWAYQFTPVLSKVESDGLLLEIKGSLQLFGGLDELLNRIRRGLRELGYKAVLAVAPTPLAAGVLARVGRQAVLLSHDELAPALSALPLEPLRLESKQQAVLDSIGVRRIGDCLRLPRGGLGRRTAPKLLDIFRRLFGETPDPRPRFELPKLFQSRVEIPWETSNALALSQAGERLLHELVGYLRACSATTRCLRWSLQYTNGQSSHFQLALTKPSRDHKHFAMLLREQLSRLRLQGKIKGLGLYVDQIAPDQAMDEGDLFKSRDAERVEDWPSFLDRLRARLGEQAVKGLKRVADHRPEYAWRWSNLDVNGELSTSSDKRDVGDGAPRPVWLMRRPVRLKTEHGALDINGPLQFLEERERIETGWWDGKPVGRDYFIAANPSGARLWIYRELSGEKNWYLHGIFE